MIHFMRPASAAASRDPVPARRRRWPAAALVVALCLAVPALLPLNAALAQQVPTTPAMPAGFDGLRLGMTLDEVRVLRPKLGRGAFDGDNAGFPKMLVERIGSEFIDQAIFLFGPTAPVLSGVMFSKAAPSAAGDLFARRFLASLVRLYGVPAQFRALTGEAGVEQIAAIWTRPEGAVLATIPLALESGGPLSPRDRKLIVRIHAKSGEFMAILNSARALSEPLERRLLDNARADAGNAAVPAYR